MSQIMVNDLTFSYDTHYENIFENIDVMLDTAWKIGLIGRNGTGKTTFLNLLLGKYAYSGHIRMSCMAEYFPVKISDPQKISIELLEEIDPQYEFWKICRELSLMEMETEILYRPYCSLSPGEQIRMQLAVLFAKEHVFLLIDEPTNHLDEEGRNQLANYLNQKNGFILVSHDRRLLDKCTDHIMAIERSRIRIYKGNFSTWKKEKQLRDEFEISQNEKLKREIKDYKEAAKKAGRWASDKEKEKFGITEGSKPDRGFIGHKAAKMMKRSKSLEKRMEKAAEQKSLLLKDIEKVIDLKLFPATYEKDRLISAEKICVAYGEKKVLTDFSLEIRRGDRIALKGVNGCGKSTFLKVLSGECNIVSGKLSVGTNLKISYIKQDSSQMTGTLDEMEEEYGLDKTIFRAVLRQLDFPRNQFEKRLEEYSEGQKKKVMLAKSLCETAHLYVWDEPLNYIDVFTRMQIEKLILEYQPTMIFVEHDQEFTEKTATKIVQMKKENPV